MPLTFFLLGSVLLLGLWLHVLIFATHPSSEVLIQRASLLRESQEVRLEKESPLWFIKSLDIMIPCLKVIDKFMGTSEALVTLLGLCYVEMIIGRLELRGQV